MQASPLNIVLDDRGAEEKWGIGRNRELQPWVFAECEMGDMWSSRCGGLADPSQNRSFSSEPIPLDPFHGVLSAESDEPISWGYTRAETPFTRSRWIVYRDLTGRGMQGSMLLAEDRRLAGQALLDGCSLIARYGENDGGSGICDPRWTSIIISCLLP
ncbi:hypothetical protein DFP72DRAFT_412781 [Ephemerocybe angulata]|uniref:Uncharacterized protein n=1 Tax=Ephemerocybe angulata TaxID=980116 RepID=A0A8H6MG11_9AGAR|nr:hypothetical protein DFP72DRAFT_412781 [Tulosesus angulatus]